MNEIETAADAHRVADPETIEADPSYSFDVLENPNGDPLFVARIRARNFERVKTWQVGNDGQTLAHVDTEHAYNYADERWQTTHEFDYEYDLTEDGGSLDYRPHMTVEEYCRDRARTCQRQRFRVYDFD